MDVVTHLPAKVSAFYPNLLVWVLKVKWTAFYCTSSSSFSDLPSQEPFSTSNWKLANMVSTRFSHKQDGKEAWEFELYSSRP